MTSNIKDSEFGIGKAIVCYVRNLTANESAKRNYGLLVINLL